MPGTTYMCQTYTGYDSLVKFECCCILAMYSCNTSYAYLSAGNSVQTKVTITVLKFLKNTPV